MIDMTIIKENKKGTTPIVPQRNNFNPVFQELKGDLMNSKT
jgi:hypothetical protein